MGIRTLVLYLFGHRPSIETIIQSRSAIWIGLLFVLSAGFAREYDGEDLLHEPWHLFLPLGASLLTSFLLFALLTVAFGQVIAPDSSGTDNWSKYLSFLGLYWMTAPLAWLYAIPVEEFLSPADSVRANLSFLGIVSLWRVVLITRAASIFFNRSFAATFFLVMFFANTVAMAVFWFTPLPIISVMGGIRLTESEAVLLSVGIMLRFFGTVTWPIWLVGAVVAKYRSKPLSPILEARVVRTDSSIGLWSLAALSLLVWIPVLPQTQPKQIHRRQAEQLLSASQISDAISYMSEHQRADFPRHWDPPPRFGLGNFKPAIDLVLAESEAPSTATWVRDLFREKYMLQLDAEAYDLSRRAILLSELDEKRLAKYVEIVKELPFGPALARRHLPEIEHGFRESPPLTESQKQSLETLKELAKDQSSTEKLSSSADAPLSSKE
jgi:hypothetical protein